MLRGVLLTIIAFLVYGEVNNQIGNNNSRLVFFNVDRSSAVYCRSDDKAVIICDSVLLNNHDKFSYALDKFILSEELDDLIKMTINDNQVYKMRDAIVYDDFILVDKKIKVLTIADDRYSTITPHDKLEVDILYLTNNISCSIDDLKGLFHFKTVVADGMNYQSNIRIWKDQCKRLGVRFISLKDEGAYVVSF